MPRRREVRREPAIEQIDGRMYPVITTEVRLTPTRVAVCEFIFLPGQQPVLRQLIVTTDDLIPEDGGIRADDLRQSIIDNARCNADNQLHQFLDQNPEWAAVVPTTRVTRPEGRPKSDDVLLVRVAQSYVKTHKLRPGSQAPSPLETQRYSVYRQMKDEWPGYTEEHLRRLKSKAVKRGFIRDDHLTDEAIQLLTQLGMLDTEAM